MAHDSPTLLTIISNDLLLRSISPYLLPQELLALSLTSRTAYSLIVHTPSVWRHVDLSLVPSSIVCKKRTYNLTTFLSRPFVVRDIQTLILDGLPVGTDFLRHLLTNPALRIRILSVRGCMYLIDESFRGLLRELATSNSSALRGVYRFTKPDHCEQSTASNWEDSGSKYTYVVEKRELDAWAETIGFCEGRIAFDTRLCRGPRHLPKEDASEAKMKIATIRLPSACAECGISPENRRREKTPPVLRTPVHLSSSAVETVCGGEDATLRCRECMKGRWCEGCGKWWCEECCPRAEEKQHVSLDCYDCGFLCESCTEPVSKTCLSCRGGYCIAHNEGADHERCEWCNSSRRRTQTSLVISPATPANSSSTKTSQIIRNPTHTFHRPAVPPAPHSIFGKLGSIASIRSVAMPRARYFVDEGIASRRRCLMTN
ncbi:hypothetical protein RUND412_008269 [Rhizina undulata]